MEVKSIGKEAQVCLRKPGAFVEKNITAHLIVSLQENDCKNLGLDQSLINTFFN